MSVREVAPTTQATSGSGRCAGRWTREIQLWGVLVCVSFAVAILIFIEMSLFICGL